MNGVHGHLMVNHLPIIFPIVGLIILITSIISKSEAVKRTAFMVYILGALVTIQTMASGEGAEEVAEKINGVTENYLKIHEETAEIFALLSYILGGISLLGLWASFKQQSFSSVITIAILVYSTVVLFFAKQTGTTGGEIRHIEIRSGKNMPAAKNNNIEKNEED